MYGHKIEGYKKAAKTVNVATRTVRSWVQDYEATQFIAESRRGRHSKTSSPILEDFEFREEFKEHVRQTSREKGKIEFVPSEVRTLPLVRRQILIYKFLSFNFL